jgi:hypothetical protein
MSADNLIFVDAQNRVWDNQSASALAEGQLPSGTPIQCGFPQAALELAEQVEASGYYEYGVVTFLELDRLRTEKAAHRQIVAEAVAEATRPLL